MSVDVSKEADNIRHKTYGLEVRGSLADGIEKVADEVNGFESGVEQKEEDFETNLIEKQNEYEGNLSNKENNFEESINNRQVNYESSLNSRQDEYESNINKAENVRISSENTRQSNESIRQTNESTRQGNEVSRQTVYNDFRNYVNSASNIGRVPYLFNGGDYGDTSPTGLTLNGGDY